MKTIQSTAVDQRRWSNGQSRNWILAFLLDSQPGTCSDSWPSGQPDGNAIKVLTEPTSNLICIGAERCSSLYTVYCFARLDVKIFNRCGAFVPSFKEWQVVFVSKHNDHCLISLRTLLISLIYHQTSSWIVRIVVAMWGAWMWDDVLIKSVTDE
jgi:hypothetical protein